MKTNELVQKLQELNKIYGDLDIVIFDAGNGPDEDDADHRQPSPVIAFFGHGFRKIVL